MSAAQTASPTKYAHNLRNEFAFLKYDSSQEGAGDLDVTVKHDGFWSHGGPLLCTSLSDPYSSLPASLHEFIDAMFTGPILSHLLPFLKFINDFLSGSGINHYLLTIRAITPTGEFDRPRWHTDDLFFSERAGGDLIETRLSLNSWNDGGNKAGQRDSSITMTDWKICTTLLGPPTLFIPLAHQLSARKQQLDIQKAASTEHECISIRCIGCATAADVVRERLAASLAECGADSAGPGECTLFRVGRKAGAIHSEPRMSESTQGRIFINVVPGTEEELKALMSKWGMEFPRQWWIGNNVMRTHPYENP